MQTTAIEPAAIDPIRVAEKPRLEFGAAWTTLRHPKP